MSTALSRDIVSPGAGAVPRPVPKETPDLGLAAIVRIAGYYRIAVDAAQLQYQLALRGQLARAEDIVRAGQAVGLKARFIARATKARVRRVPLPAIVTLNEGGFAILAGFDKDGNARLVDPVSQVARLLAPDEFSVEWARGIVLLKRRNGIGNEPETFGFRWFLPSLWRYRRPLGHVLIASLFVQIFALVTPLFFQIVVDKVLAHRSQSTLTVVVAGLCSLGLFSVALQYLRSYALAHTTNRIDVELGARLFHRLLRLPLGYLETRPAGQTVARVRELETIRAFLTGQGLFSFVDLLFAFIFAGVLFAYSTTSHGWFWRRRRFMC